MIGKRLAHYDILDLLGKGGMGEVYRALDTKLGREVAVKSLPPEWAQDPERLARFRREAQMLASVNHPNIAGIYGFEQSDGHNFLVMELVEGEELSSLISRGPLPVDEALRIAAQIAEGLEEAHEKNIVHRDLKPANVMVNAEGKIKILDFGLARAFVGDTAVEGDPALSPTVTSAMTQTGVILGSAAYMSPEQAKGRMVDRRADIWAFGVILFEMITGRTLFSGETISETMASVLKDPVDYQRLPSGLPAGVRDLLERCLERDPKLRLRDIGEARIHLQAPSGSAILRATAAKPDIASPTEGSRWNRLAWALFVVAALAAVGFAINGRHSGTGPLEVFQVSIESPGNSGFHLAGANPAPAVLSPDGQRIVFGARAENSGYSLWVRHLSNAEPHPLPGTDRAQYPFWSPDSRSIGYFANGGLRVVELDGRMNRELTRCEDMKGAAWLEDGTILFSPSPSSGISRVSNQGGEATVVTALGDVPNSNSLRLPSPLPVDDHFLFAARIADAGNRQPVAVMLGSLRGEPPRLLVEADGQAAFANGHILFVSQGKLLARPFDLDRLAFSGPAKIINEDAGLIPGAALALFSVSENGRILYHPGHDQTMSGRLAWFGMDGERQGFLGESAGIGEFSVSPDGKRVALITYDNRNGMGDIYLDDVETGVRSRLTFSGEDEGSPIWSADSRSLYYLRGSPPTSSIMRMRPDSPDAPERVRTPRGAFQLLSVSPDDHWMTLTVMDSTTNELGFALLNLQSPEDFVALDDDIGTPSVAHFSPDGRWILYNAKVESDLRLYLKTFPLSARKWEVVSSGAFTIAWDPSGQRAYFQGLDDRLFVVDLDLHGTTPRFGESREVFAGLPVPLSSLHTFAVDADGSRILIPESNGSSDARPARLVLNWPALLGDAR